MKIGIITGASSGMGKEFVKLTMSEQLNLDEIWVIARRKERLEAWQKHYAEQTFRVLALDLQKEEDMERLRKELEETQPEISVPVLELWGELMRFLPRSRWRWWMSTAAVWWSLRPCFCRIWKKAAG